MDAVVRELRGEDPVSALDRAQELAQAASVATLEQVVEIDEHRLWQADGATSITAWLAARYQRAWATTREWVRVAHALRALPEIREAYRAGRLSWDQLRPLTRFASPEDDERWARRAPRMRPAGLWQEARRREEVREEHAEAVHRLRYLRLDWNEPRTLLHIEGMLGAEQGAMLETALETRAEAIEPGESVADPQGARLADALVQAATSSGDRQDGARLVVHADAAVVAGVPAGGAPRLAETESGVRLSDEAVRRLACDAAVEWVLEAEGRPVGVGRRTRSIPPAIMRLLRHRDGTCRFPGCEHRRWLKAHHVRHWAAGGSTDLDNLILLCHPHHRLVHEGGWRVHGDPARDLRFHDPAGRPIRGRADPLPLRR